MTTVAPPPSPAVPRPNGVPTPGWRFVGVAAGVLFAVAGLLLTAVGTAGLVWRGTADGRGFVSLGSSRWTSGGEAVTTDDFWLDAGGMRMMTGLLGDTSVRVRVTSNRDVPVFVGVAPTATVDSYLGTASYSRVGGMMGGPYRYTSGTARPAAPASVGGWVARAEGVGTQQLTWAVGPGHWTLVVMNADASPVVDVRVEVGAHADHLPWISLTVLLLGVIMVAIGTTAAVSLRPRRGFSTTPSGVPSA